MKDIVYACINKNAAMKKTEKNFYGIIHESVICCNMFLVVNYFKFFRYNRRNYL